MEMVNLTNEAGVRTAILVLIPAILGTARAIEGLEGLGFFSRLPAAYARRVRASLQVMCGVVQIAAAILLGGGH